MDDFDPGINEAGNEAESREHWGGHLSPEVKVSPAEVSRAAAAHSSVFNVIVCVPDSRLVTVPEEIRAS